ncbi:hypothetical protein ASF99_02545 [Exiguobacterium sp. Leaf187]|uniref:hypothetical protein n=1 Tax=Exiguobacterium sp. Leaf187 TaxID=1736294 RepID=UPI0006FB7E4F|nr:hypothetical protein [Exiguobacterium sp. Leaf187]KQS18784.1 hypothetical protein ASF99_02545 [Exiguobacterium sp. Leaf187]
MKKEVRPLIYTLIVLVILITAYPTYLFVSKTMTEIKIERMLVESGYDQDISKKETIFESKTGRYVSEINTRMNQTIHTTMKSLKIMY